MKKIVVVGSINMDLVVSTEEIPNVGETVIGKSITQVPGGKGANQAVAMAKLNSDVKFLGKIGNDDYGKNILKYMKKSGVKTEHIKVIDDSTGLAVINVDEAGNNNIIVIPGANGKVSSEFVLRNMQIFETTDVAVFQFEIPIETVKSGLRAAKANNNITILNPAPAFDLDDETISLIDILIPNEYEIERMSKIKIKDEQSILEAANILIDKGIKQIIITLGSKGAMYVDKDTHKYYKSYDVNVVDTTGAGDSFIGGFTSSYIQSNNIDEAIDFGQRTAALSIQKFGAQSSMPELSEVENFKGVKR